MAANKLKGRPPGAQNKVNALLKEAGIMAAEIAGNELANKDKLPGLVNYLRIAAKTEMVAYLAFLGKILPTQIVDKNGDDVQFTRIERVIINANGRDYRLAPEPADVKVIDAERVLSAVEAG